MLAAHFGVKGISSMLMFAPGFPHLTSGGLYSENYFYEHLILTRYAILTRSLEEAERIDLSYL